MVDDRTGALAPIDGLALRLTKEEARATADRLNSEARRNDEQVGASAG